MGLVFLKHHVFRAERKAEVLVVEGWRVWVAGFGYRRGSVRTVAADDREDFRQNLATKVAKLVQFLLQYSFSVYRTSSISTSTVGTSVDDENC